MFYKKKGSSVSQSEVRIDGNATLIKDATGLDKYTEYEFQVLAFTSVGDGPKSSFVVKRTKEDGKKYIYIIDNNSTWLLICKSLYCVKFSPKLYQVATLKYLLEHSKH